MKKTLTVNLSGSIFRIDEDAYHILDNYLKSLASHFANDPDKRELMEDFEHRISELLTELTPSVGGERVVTIEKVEEVIGQLGDPKDIFEDEDDSKQSHKTFSSENIEPGRTRRKLFRNPDDKMLGGVCGGLAAFWGVDAQLLRIITIILALVTNFGLILCYIACWLFIPEARTAVDKMRMRGEEVTVESIGQNIRIEVQNATIQNPPSNNSGCLAVGLKIIGIIAIIICAPVILALGIAFIAIILALIVGIPFAAIDGMNCEFAQIFSSMPNWEMVTSLIALFCFIFISMFGIVRFFMQSRKDTKPLSIGVKWALFILWVMCFIAMAYGGVSLLARLS